MRTKLRFLFFFVVFALLCDYGIYCDIGETPQEKKDLKKVQITRWQMCEGLLSSSLPLY